MRKWQEPELVDGVLQEGKWLLIPVSTEDVPRMKALGWKPSPNGPGLGVIAMPAATR